MQQRSLEQKEKQLTETGKRVDQAEDQNKLLKKELSQLQHSSHHFAMEAADIVRKKEELETGLVMKKKHKERLLTQKPFMTDMELWLQMIHEVQVSIDDIQKHTALLKMKKEQQNSKEKQWKEEISKKQKELDNRDRALQALKKKYSLLRSKLNAERIVFDFKLRVQQQSSEKVQEELKVGVVQYKEHIIDHIFIVDFPSHKA